MKSISMDLINQVKELKEKTGLSTRSALEVIGDSGIYNELPDVPTMDAILRGLEVKHGKKEKRMFKKIIGSRRREEDIVSYIEQEAGCTIPGEAREAIINELRVSYELNGHISQGYIDNLIKAYRYMAHKNETANLAGSAASVAS